MVKKILYLSSLSSVLQAQEETIINNVESKKPQSKGFFRLFKIEIYERQNL